MRIGILTQPLYCNYGGLLQCYALQHTLQRMGHEAIVVRREWNRQYSFKGAYIYYVKHIVKMLMGKRESWHYYVAQEKRDYIAQNTYKFINKHIIPYSNYCYSTEELRNEVERLQLDAIIVGSDQVWRPHYSPCQPNYFLDFLPLDSRIKRISYAASFGGDDWLFSPELTAQCSKLLKRFDAVSVREQSAIGLCKKYFNVDAVQVLDPTMLLESVDYKVIIGSCSKDRGSLFCYILDRTEEKNNIIKKIAERVGKKPFESMPELPDEVYNLYGKIDKCIYPPVEDWVSAFMEADMVVTDSFHGTVFSIIFNKPFWVVGNESRGMARFQSLLSMYGLEDRLITVKSLQEIDFNTTIKWDSVNEKRRMLQVKSKEFITKALL
ncbi:polysaccharide pyruvyl transferase family protein [Bacteroides acidifaciens]|uniref:Polysaccharide pyruvyl transferase family protein n=1 Tax=Bacteroides acidifaciens TaxID=85831 RepID=A0A3L8A8P8_9BACE|nr:polysaccharide pyruvyl transferase family protein [Bacteroides acidifaciens]RLT80081.1 polysaccharide pyruvyl transferase family protein [Bacteroides acidifaciens]